MLTAIREKFSAVIVTGIVGLIALTFAISGDFMPGQNMGGATAGSVNGEQISIAEFSRAYQQRVEFFKNMKLDSKQLKNLGLATSVFQELVNRKLLIQEAKRQGIVPSDAEIRLQITKLPVFQEDGHFDRVKYKEVLSANRLTPGKFEEMVRDDLIVQSWSRYFKNRVLVSNEEVKKEFLFSENKRKINYVLISKDKLKKDKKITTVQLKDYMRFPEHLELMKNRYDAGINGRFKGKKFEDVKLTLAQELVEAEQVEKLNAKIKEITAQLTKSISNPTGSAFKSTLRKWGLKVETSDWFTRDQTFLKGIGSAEKIVQDSFSPNVEARTYDLPVGTAVAIVSEKKIPKLSNLDEKKQKSLADELIQKKYQMYQEELISGLRESASIKMNEEYVDQVSS